MNFNWAFALGSSNDNNMNKKMLMKIVFYEKNNVLHVSYAA